MTATSDYFWVILLSEEPSLSVKDILTAPSGFLLQFQAMFGVSLLYHAHMYLYLYLQLD